MSRRLGAPGTVAAITVVATIALLPIARHSLGTSTSFVPAMLAVVASFDALSVYLLVGDYLDNGDTRLLAMSWAYLWSLVLMGGYSLAFPGVWVGTPFATAPSVAPWLYICWHAGFPALLGLAWARWPKAVRPVTTRASRGRATALSSALVATLALGMVAFIVMAGHRLPVVIHGIDTHRMMVLTAPVVIPIVLLALLSSRRGTRLRLGPERWVSVAVLVCLCDLVLTYTARYRYSYGWYAGRALTLTGAAVVAAAMLAEFRRIKRLAEQGAATDSLTGLPNRRALEVALASELARAARRGAVTSVLLLDLDNFKTLNDTHGHAAGDKVLCEVGASWASRLRMGDVLARLGGDEFVVVLPDTGSAGAQVVATKLFAAAAPIIGVSIGVAVAIPSSPLANDSAGLLEAADAAMYDVKARRRLTVPPAGAQVPTPRVSPGVEVRA